MTEQAHDLTSLVRAHRAEVYSFLLALTRDETAAEDLVQEVFLLALRKKLRPGPGMRRWLRDVARNLALNDLRKKRPVPISAEDIERAVAAVSVQREDDRPTRFEDEVAALRECMQGLNPADREVLAARYEHGTPLAQIASRVKQTVGYIKQRLLRLRRRLALCIERRLAQRGGAHA